MTKESEENTKRRRERGPYQRRPKPQPDGASPRVPGDEFFERTSLDPDGELFDLARTVGLFGGAWRVAATVARALDDASAIETLRSLEGTLRTALDKAANADALGLLEKHEDAVARLLTLVAGHVPYAHTVAVALSEVAHLPQRLEALETTLSLLVRAVDSTMLFNERRSGAPSKIDRLLFALITDAIFEKEGTQLEPRDLALLAAHFDVDPEAADDIEAATRRWRMTLRRVRGQDGKWAPDLDRIRQRLLAAK